MEKKTIRMLEINDEYVRRCDTACMQVFEKIARDPENAKAMRGSLILHFKPESRVPYFADPARRLFVQKLDLRFPFLPYFLLPEPKLDQVSSYMQCLLPGDAVQIGASYGMPVVPLDLLNLLRRKIESVIRFSRLIRDDSSDRFIHALVGSAPNPSGVLDELMAVAGDPGNLLKVLDEILPLPLQSDDWHEVQQDLEYVWFKRSMDDDPFRGSKGDEIHVDAAVLRKLVCANPGLARRWFDEMLETAASMPNPSMAKLLVGILLMVGGLLEEMGDPQALRAFHQRFGRK